jgi:hypothetical protein
MNVEIQMLRRARRPCGGMIVTPDALRLARGMGGRPVRGLRVRASRRCSVVPRSLRGCAAGGSGSHGPNNALPDPEPPEGGTTIRALQTAPPWGLHAARRRTPHSAFRIPHSAFRIPHSAFRIQHSSIPASSIQHPASSIQHPASSIQHPASSIHPLRAGDAP